MDHVPCLKAWADSFEGISYPLVSDFWPHGKIAKKYGVLRKDGRTERAIFIIDKKGVIRYIDIHDIDEQPDNDVLFAELDKIVPQEDRKGEIKVVEDDAPLPKGGVVMYCTKWCPDCRSARRWLEKHNIQYTEVDIMRSSKASKQVKEWANGNLVTPTFDIDGTIIVDWEEEKVAEVLLNK